MSRLFEGWDRATIQQGQLNTAPPDLVPADLISHGPPEADKSSTNTITSPVGSAGTVQLKKLFEIERARSVMVQPPQTSRLVSWMTPNSLGAEKFRALAVRLDNMRRQHKLQSVQITSSVISEGKTFVAANLAVTLAMYSGARTLLIEGDLHRPTLGATFGLKDLPGLSDWWSRRSQDLGHFLVRLTDKPLWFLPAGKPCDRPSEILRSVPFSEAFADVAGRVDWVIVDSTPMLPIIDANLWSRLVDGTLLVIREGMTPLKALKSGLQALDNPKLIGVVVNEASEFDQANYHGQYYGARKHLGQLSE